MQFTSEVARNATQNGTRNQIPNWNVFSARNYTYLTYWRLLHTLLFRHQYELPRVHSGLVGSSLCRFHRGV